ncbi:MAG: hypothetical protein DCC65_08780 [Planctomycetota bacterium]|nr:MAG: hypothetical protein DCC65_08780 [Planctomycetota bacterium]
MPEHARDHPGDLKRREAAFEHLRAELFREAGNRAAFTAATRRILARPEVQRDSELRAMLKQVINEREAQFPKVHAHLAPRPLGVLHIAAEKPSQERRDRDADSRELLKLLIHQFEDAIHYYHETTARATFQKMKAVWERHPALKPPHEPSHSEGELARLVERRNEFLAHVDELANKATVAAREGNAAQVSRTLRRLTSIHAMHPELLPAPHLEDIRRHIQAAAELHEDKVLARKLLERERTVAAEIRHLAHAIHHFQRVARSVPHDAAAYAAAEARYREAVKALSAHDADWLAGIILELVDILGAFHTPQKTPQEQVDRFVASVRSALVQLRKEVRQNASPTDSQSLHLM